MLLALSFQSSPETVNDSVPAWPTYDALKLPTPQTPVPQRFYGTNWIERTWLPVESNCELDGMSGDCPWRIGSSAPHIRANVIKAKKAGYLFVWSKLKLNPALHYNYIRLFQLENNLIISFLGVGDFGCGVYWFKKKKKKTSTEP